MKKNKIENLLKKDPQYFKNLKEKIESKNTSKKALKFMLFYVKKHILFYIAGILVLMVVDLLQLIIPKFIRQTMDVIGQSTVFSEKVIFINSLKIVLFALLMVILRFFWRFFIIGSARKIEKEIREDIFIHLQNLSFSFFNKTKTGDLMALMINDLKAIARATGPSFIALTDALFLGSMSLFFMLSINVKLTLYVMLPLPFIIFIMVKFGPMIQTRFKKVQEAFASISSFTQESFSGIRVIKGFSQNNSRIKKFTEKCDDYVIKNIKLVKVWGLFFPLINLLASFSMALLYLLGSKDVILGTISMGDFISFSFYINLIVWPMMAVGFVFNIFQRGIASAKRVLEVIDEETDIKVIKPIKKLKKIYGDIEFKNLTFAYPGTEKPVLKDINLKIKKGMSIGIMGRPGSGKTTLVSLLFHLFPVQKDKIIIDGYDINNIPLKVLRSSIGYVPQDPFLFSDTILNNICFGLDTDQIDMEKVKEVTKIADIYDDIINFPEGFNTEVGERGIALSGGQKQRISIARALIINPEILILDDALSSVDASTEKIILKNIKGEISKRTSIIIAHRVSTVMDCDLIIVLDDGKIVEHGTHEELLRNDGFYARVYRLQKLEDKIFE